jgi:hypothetical protein
MAETKYEPRYQSSWALVVGINAYEYCAPLSYARNDADAMTAVLVGQLDFPHNQVIVLKDDQATKQAILDNYLGFRDRASNPDDRLLVFFAGHGTTKEGYRGPVGYLVPVDGNPDSLSSLIRWDDLTRNAELIPAKHILFIMDACYSGLAIQRAISPGTQRFLSDVLQRLSRQVITAGKADETVADGGGPQGKNSIFTGYLLRGLDEAAGANGVLTANGLMHYVYQKVGQDSRSQQTPHYGHIEGDGDFVLLTPNGEHLGNEGQPDSLVETATEVPESVPPHSAPLAIPTFAERNGYGDPTSPNFGRNDWSNKLAEYRHTEREASKAFSWLSVIVEPISIQPISIDIAEVARLRQLISVGDRPYKRFQVPQQSRTTNDSLIFFDWLFKLMPEDTPSKAAFWECYLRLNENGNIEYADSNRNVFGEYNGVRYFQYVQIIGTIWQFMFLAKKILTDAGYSAGARLLVNLVGTRDSILIDFSREPGEGNQKWLDAFRSDEFGRTSNISNQMCSDPNLQLKYNLVMGNLNEEQSQKTIKDIARQLGLAYNHQSSPRCFNCNTDIFPWRQYFNGR